MNPCVIPAIKSNGGEKWKMQHKQHIAKAKDQNPDVILIGDSIIELIQYNPIWNDKFAALNSFNFGISGDRVEHVLWRVQNCILDHIKPKVCILNVGSNNVDNIPVDISEGILAIVHEIRLRLSDCYIIIIGILPRSAYPDFFRNLGDQVNQILEQKVTNMSKVKLFIANDLLKPDGSLSLDNAPDFRHPSELGYRKIFNPIFEYLSSILNS